MATLVAPTLLERASKRGEVDHAEVVLVLDDLVADLDHARARCRRGCRACHWPLSSAAAITSGFRLEPGSKRSVMARLRKRFGAYCDAVVRVVGGLVHHRQHFAGVGVEHDGGAGQRAIVLDRGLELAVREVLDAQVDGGDDFAARARRLQALDVLDHPPEPVAQDHLLAGMAAQPFVEGELHALLAVVVHVGEAHQVAGHLAGRVVAPVLAQHVDARECRGRGSRARPPDSCAAAGT